MRRTVSALTLGMMLVWSTAAYALDAGDTCELTKRVRVSAKFRGKGRKKNAKKGAAVEVLEIRKKWANVQSGEVSGWVKLSALERSCVLQEAPPEPEAAIAPAGETFDDSTAAPGEGVGTDSDVGSSDVADPAASESDDPFAEDASSAQDSSPVDETSGSTDEFGNSNDDFFDSEPSSGPIDEAPTFQIGNGLVYGIDLEEFGIRAEFLYNLSFLLPNLRAGANFNYFLVDSDLSLITINVNGYYTFFRESDIDVYGLAGLNWARASIEFEAFGETISESESDIGLNLGGGAEWAGLEIVSLFAEVKYLLNDEDDFILSTGGRIGF